MAAYGPIDHALWGTQPEDGWLNELHEPLDGIELGEYDRRILEWATSTLDNPTLTVLVSLLNRARAAEPLPIQPDKGELMTISPKVYAGYKAVTELLAGMDVRIKHPEQSAMEFVMSMHAHSVHVACWMTDAVVTYEGADGDAAHTTSVRYPVSHEDPDFKTKLGEVLLPVVEEYLSRVQQAQSAQS